MAFMEELQEEKHHVGRTINMWKKVLGSDEINNQLFGLHAKCFV